MTFSEGIEVVAMMLRGYPNGRDAHDGYIGALAEVLAHYPRMIASRAGDLWHGVPAATRFLPTPADIIAWCERELSSLRAIVQRDDDRKRLELEMLERAEKALRLVEARRVRPSLAELKDQYGENWGISMTDEQELAAAEARRLRLVEANQRVLEREWGDREAPQAAPGLPLSRALVEHIEARPAPVPLASDPHEAAP
jgi:hypothetical protein